MPSCLEIFCYSNIEVWIRARCSGFVDHIAAVTLAVEGARFSFRSLAVAFLLFSCCSCFPVLHDFSIVGLEYLFDVGGTAVRNFECIPIEDGVEFVVAREMFLHELQKYSANFSFQGLVEVQTYQPSQITDWYYE